MNRCDICGCSSNDIKHISNLYVMGSEGVRVCNDCSVALTNYARTLQSLAGRIKIEEIRRKIK